MYEPMFKEYSQGHKLLIGCLTIIYCTKKQWDNIMSTLLRLSSWHSGFLPFFVVNKVSNYIFFTPLKFATFVSLLTIMYSSLYCFVLATIPVLLSQKWADCLPLVKTVDSKRVHGHCSMAGYMFWLWTY